MITCEAFVAWRLERTDLCNLFARGVDVGWEARPGGGVVVVRNLIGGERLTYRTLDEAGGFVDGFHWGGVSREAVPRPPVDYARFEAEMLAGGYTWDDLRRSSDQAARGETVTLAEIRDQRAEPD